MAKMGLDVVMFDLETLFNDCILKFLRQRLSESAKDKLVSSSFEGFDECITTLGSNNIPGTNNSNGGSGIRSSGRNQRKKYSTDGDFNKIKRILENLLDNAVKFTNMGNIRVRLGTQKIEINRLRMKTKENYKLTFEIKDTGIGIAEEAQPSLFKIFEQEDNNITRKFDGLGLGLALSRKLAQLMGGEVWCESAAGKGSTFYFSTIIGVQHIISQGNSPEPQLEVIKQDEEKDLKLLVVDDNLINRKIIIKLLTVAGYQADMACDGLEALHKVEKGKYDAVFMDIHMPKMDGLEATRRIRNSKEILRQPKVVAVTADVVQGIQQQCKDSGMDGYICKPFTKGKVENLLAFFAKSRSGKETGTWYTDF